MAKKVILKDLENESIMPITRGELILDSSGNMAFNSNEFIATENHPGLLSKEDKLKLNNIEESLPIASNTLLGGVKIGTTVDISEDGTLSIPIYNSSLRNREGLVPVASSIQRTGNYFLKANGTWAIPANTKVNVVTKTSKSYLLATTTAATTTATSVTAVSDTAVYLDVDAGSLTATKMNTSSGFYETSDERLKTFGNDIAVNLDKLAKLPKKYFTWKNSNDKNTYIGTSAQAVQELYPELVSKDENGTLSVAYDKLSMIALKGIDVLNDKIKSLEERIERLEKLLNV